MESAWESEPVLSKARHFPLVTSQIPAQGPGSAKSGRDTINHPPHFFPLQPGQCRFVSEKFAFFRFHFHKLTLSIRNPSDTLDHPTSQSLGRRTYRCTDLNDFGLEGYDDLSPSLSASRRRTPRRYRAFQCQRTHNLEGC